MALVQLPSLAPLSQILSAADDIADMFSNITKEIKIIRLNAAAVFLFIKHLVKKVQYL